MKIEDKYYSLLLVFERESKLNQNGQGQRWPEIMGFKEKLNFGFLSIPHYYTFRPQVKWTWAMNKVNCQMFWKRRAYNLCLSLILRQE